MGFESVFLAAMSLASLAVSAPFLTSDARTAPRRRRISLDWDWIVFFWCRDLLRAARNWGPAMGFESVFLSVRSLASLACSARFRAWAPSRDNRNQNASSVSERPCLPCRAAAEAPLGV